MNSVRESLRTVNSAAKVPFSVPAAGLQANDWLNNEECQPGDLDRNGVVDWADVMLLTQDWLKTTSWYTP